jgi:putative transposase
VPDKPERDRQSHRWRGFDYSAPCGYFVTICVEDRRCLFGRVIAGETISRGRILSTREVDEGRAARVELSPLGRIVDECWREIPAHFPAVATPSHVVMPNHIHGIVRITPTPEWTAQTRQRREEDSKPRGTRRGDIYVAPTPAPTIARGPSPKSLGVIIGTFKAAVTRRARQLGLINDTLWQRDFFDRVLRDETEWSRAATYIHLNPVRWALDRENPERSGDDEFDQWLDS